MKAKIKLTSDRAIAPTQRSGDIGADLYACHDHYVQPGQRMRVDIGVAIELPDGYGALVLPRSGCALLGRIVHTGVIDRGYRGSISAIAENLSGDRWPILRGDRIAQIVIVPVPAVEYEISSELSETDRGDRGFGSSGR